MLSESGSVSEATARAKSESDCNGKAWKPRADVETSGAYELMLLEQQRDES